jgi:hypothetical protein
MLKRNIFIICVIYLIFNIIFSLYKYFNNKSTIIFSVFLYPSRNPTKLRTPIHKVTTTFYMVRSRKMSVQY